MTRWQSWIHRSQSQTVTVSFWSFLVHQSLLQSLSLGQEHRFSQQQHCTSMFQHCLFGRLEWVINVMPFIFGACGLVNSEQSAPLTCPQKHAGGNWKLTSSTNTTRTWHQTLFPRNKSVWMSPYLDGMNWVTTGLILVCHNMWQNWKMDVRSRMQHVVKVDECFV